MNRACLLAAAALAVGCTSASATPTPLPAIGCEGCIVLAGAVVFDGVEAGIGSVVMRGAVIEQVVIGSAEVTAGEIVDLGGATVMPGLYDLHVHAPASAGPRGYYPSESLVDAHLAAMLRAGVTTFLDLGSSRRIVFEHRARIAAGTKLGPHMRAAGAMITPTGGHPCLAGGPPGDACWFVDGAADVAGVMAEALAEDPDVIKVIIESGQTEPLPRLGFEEVKAIVAAAGETPVIAHVSHVDDIELALAAGVRAFAHMPVEPLGEAVLASLADSGAVIVPTLAVYDGYHRLAEGELAELDDPRLADDVPAEVIDILGDPRLVGRYRTHSFRELAARWRAIGLANARAAFDAGVRLAAGTDAGNAGTFHGLALARELALYVEAGMTPLAALTAATSNAAGLVGDPGGGRLAPGARARSTSPASCSIATRSPSRRTPTSRRWPPAGGAPARPASRPRSVRRASTAVGKTCAPRCAARAAPARSARRAYRRTRASRASATPATAATRCSKTASTAPPACGSATAPRSAGTRARRSAASPASTAPVPPVTNAAMPPSAASSCATRPLLRAARRAPPASIEATTPASRSASAAELLEPGETLIAARLCRRVSILDRSRAVRRAWRRPSPRRGAGAPLPTSARFRAGCARGPQPRLRSSYDRLPRGRILDSS
jgi:imidazolonepropionase-like amidohydrolase